MKMTMNDSVLNIWRKVLSVCKASDCMEIVVTFDGSGDSGRIEDIDFQFYDPLEESADNDGLAIPKDLVTLSIGVFDLYEDATYRNGRWESVIKQKELTIKNALEIITYEILNKNISGWEINEGTITYDIDTGAIKCESNERIIRTVEDTFTFTDETE